MKSLITTTALFFCFLFGNAQSDSNQKEESPIEVSVVEEDYIKWENLVYDFGEIPQNKAAKAVFKFSNRGKTPFLLTKVNGSCGCTDIEYPETPILSGTTETVEATYDAKELGKFVKSVTVFTDKEARPYILMLRGLVIEKTKEQ